MKTALKSLLIAGLLANAALGAYAQSATAAQPMAAASSPKMHSGAMPRHHRGMEEGRWNPTKMEAMVTRHLADLKTRLKITAEQEGAWSTFSAAMQPPAHPDEHARLDRTGMDKLTTPERIDKMRALRAQRIADMQARQDKRDDATKALYAALNSDQKKILDAEHSKMAQRWDKRAGQRGSHGGEHDGGGQAH